MLVAAALYEATALSLFGATLGKALFGLRILSQSGQRLSWEEAFERTVSVYVRGLWLGIVPAVPVLMACLHFKKRGRTRWDELGGSLVQYAWIGNLRFILCCALALGAWLTW